jgi:phosphatidylinositol alpha 1,6-mannosyltransferase
MRQLRVALFACAYTEVDGVANTVRHFEAFAKRHELPLLNVHGGYDSYREQDGSVERFEFPRRWPKFRLDAKHDFDLNFWRYLGRIEKVVRDFRPDLLHITGPSDVGQLGALVAHRLHIPLVASWHTNVHQYAERRLMALIPGLSERGKEKYGANVREICLRLTARFYQIARVLFAPNQELIAELERRTHKPCYLMSRGVDTELFHPLRRTRNDGKFVIGYVGRLTTEKNVRFLADLEKGLLARGLDNFEISIVGQGSEDAWLRQNLKHAQFPGVLTGERLGEAYANFDVFAFPSHTDTFGNVVLEALAAGVPAVVTDSGGPKFIVQQGTTGFVCRNDNEFVEYVAALCGNREICAQMAAAARQQALASSWDAVFRYMYERYDAELFRSRTAGNLVPGLARA